LPDGYGVKQYKGTTMPERTDRFSMKWDGEWHITVEVFRDLGLAERSELRISLDISPDFGRLPRDMELAVFRLVQESLTNIHRHSGSKTATIRIARDASQITVYIEDAGCGMPPQRLAEIQSGGSGVGIRGMRERLQQFEAEMKIESNECGTRIFVTIPIATVAKSEDEPDKEP
jgi:signal transduction histidine kinase